MTLRQLLGCKRRTQIRVVLLDQRGIAVLKARPQLMITGLAALTRGQARNAGVTVTLHQAVNLPGTQLHALGGACRREEALRSPRG